LTKGSTPELLDIALGYEEAGASKGYILAVIFFFALIVFVIAILVMLLKRKW